ncbi:MAG: hypothetical protein COW73_04605 [Nitrospirae bacterium CG18_big_fil_WC_8_21_14_2_50_70_55]|nr:MAG: hypothetical protein AUK30_09335 [Nitrospirae bacterium CG2_30_70_394]PIQ05781.1 MAG: hypothetical protein COW73_04605 [Nitrospirae bacterium CG18_big_fil_WC_8_21_14_2_50_70_55]
MVAAYAATIFGLSAQTGSTAPELIANFDKVCHGVEYGGFTAVLAAALTAGSSPFVLTRAALLATLYGVSDEYHQSFIPGRDSSVWDVAADATGATTVALLLAQLRRHRRRQSP